MSGMRRISNGDGDESSEGQQAVLGRFVEACEADERIVAAFLGGSRGAGREDEWSDLDVYVVTSDEDYEDFGAQLREFVGRLGEPVFLEDFGLGHTLFFVLAGGTEGELGYGCESRFLDIHAGAYRALVDKKGVLAGAEFIGEQRGPDEQLEMLRRQVYWFWHNLSHFVTALGRGELWWAQGQLEALRACCVNLARLRRNMADDGVGDEPYFKVEKAISAADLEPLRGTFGPVERAHLLRSVMTVLEFYREIAPGLAEEHGVVYPERLEEVTVSRLARLQGLGRLGQADD
jgi:predicted nucleotidyltransferase